MIERLFNRTNIIEKALDGTWTRNEAISQNIANVDTPGYKRKTVPFEDILNQAIEDKNSSGFIRTGNLNVIPLSNQDSKASSDFNVTEDNASLSYRLDGNNVDIENEMAAMAKNTIQYNTLIQRESEEFKTLKSAIKEGK